MIDNRINFMMKAMIWINVIMYVVSLVFSKGLHFTLNPLIALAPSSNALIFLGASGTIALHYAHDWLNVFTANWLHGSLLHIVFQYVGASYPCPAHGKGSSGSTACFPSISSQVPAGSCSPAWAVWPLTIGASAGLCGLIGALFLFWLVQGRCLGKDGV